MIRRFFNRVALLALLVFAFALPVAAQTSLTSTTLAAALSDTSSQYITITSATGWLASSASTTYLAVVDKEAMTVRTITGTTVLVTRGVAGTRSSPHVSGAVITTGPANAFQAFVPAGQCTRTNLLFVPWVVVGDQDLSNNGLIFDCLGVAPNGQWVTVNASGPAVIGSTVASAASSVAITGNYYKISGTAAITGFNLPAGAAAGWCFSVEPTGIFTTTTAGNIGLASTAVVGRVLVECWNGAKWQPSY